MAQRTVHHPIRRCPHTAAARPGGQIFVFGKAEKPRGGGAERHRASYVRILHQLYESALRIRVRKRAREKRRQFRYVRFSHQADIGFFVNRAVVPAQLNDFNLRKFLFKQPYKFAPAHRRLGARRARAAHLLRVAGAVVKRDVSRAFQAEFFKHAAVRRQTFLRVVRQFCAARISQ